MPGTVYVKVVEARDLPVMDKRSELTDAFVEIKLGSGWTKTEVCPKTLYPKWNSQWFKFNVTDEELQDEPLQLKVLDRDIYSAHDAIGRVYIALNPLVECGSAHSSLEGWFPIFDTLHGVRGEVYVQVKLDVIQDQQRFKQSSFGVQFYSCTREPEGVAILCIHGFVEELVVNDDPEYQWIDRLRTPRSSNEARQRLFLKLSGELRRKIGAKALDVEANAILGYKQFFDIEGESGLVVRGIGTCVSLVPKPPNFQLQIPVCFPSMLDGVRPPSANADTLLLDDGGLFEPLTSPQHSHPVLPSPSATDTLPPSPSKTSAVDSIMATSSASGPPAVLTTPLATHPSALKHVMATSEYPFYTITSLPDGVLTHIGGLVTARSVKLLDKINNPDDPETRDAWWREVRDEMRSHLRVLGCSVLVGYSEYTSICDSLCVFSATGTAVTLTQTFRKPPTSPGSEGEVDSELKAQNISQTESPVRGYPNQLPCSVFHIPYSTTKLPIDMKATFCCVCRTRQVPSIILSTSALPAGVAVRGRGCMVQARLCVPKRKMKGEENAFKVSKELPFLEHELHSRLLNKLYVHGMNAVFGLKTQVSVGENVISGLATGTAVFLEALPSPPYIHFQSKEGTQKTTTSVSLDTVQATVDQALKANMKTYGLLVPLEVQLAETGSEVVGVVDDTPTEPDLTAGKKDVFLTDLSDVQLYGGQIHAVSDRALPEGYDMSSLSTVPGIAARPYESKMVTLVRKAVFSEQRGRLDRQFSDLFSHIIQALCFKVRYLSPCSLSNVQFDVEFPEEEEIQVSVTTVVARSHLKGSEVTNEQPKRSSEEFIFDMEESHDAHRTNRNVQTARTQVGGKMVLMSPAPLIAGYAVEKYLGRVNVFLIRESTSIRESGGLGVFLDLFLLEANSILRANVKAVGGNAILNYQLNKCVLIDHPYKNQGQCLLDICGDTVRLVRTSSTKDSAASTETLERTHNT